MTPERWQQVKSTLAGALERDDTRERSSFLQQECAGDIELEREVRSLLDQPTDHFDACAAIIGCTNDDSVGTSNAGRRIGAYELIRELGRGGMGTVWLAQRADRQFEKFVAIKLLKRGTDTDEVLRRFRAEREILARLEHPNIARLIDAGTTDDELPYFVMEYVDGIRLTDFVRERQPTLRQRLQLFLRICSAVQLAHQNLVVHRDLKPGNILVTADGEPKLLDFGIAKLLGTGGEAWEITVAGHDRLTPSCASPEQVRGEPVTTVSDVYSLGALLYELLTERPAHRFGEKEPTPTEVSRVVCDEEPVRPSAATVAPEMRRHLRGDLDTIVARALAKHPARRYSTAGNLADDLTRYLERRPVLARADSAAYRARKFVARNKTAVTAAMLVVAAVIAGAASTMWQARRAERRFNDVRKIANSLMFEFHDAIKDLPGSLAARQLVTQRAVEYLDMLAQDAAGDLTLQSELALAYRKVGFLTWDVGEAIAVRRKAIVCNEALVAASPDTVAYRQQLADSYLELSDMLKVGGQSEASINTARQGLATMQALMPKLPQDTETLLTIGHHFVGLATATAEAGYLTAALETELAAMAVQEKALAGAPADAHALNDIGGTLGRLSDVYGDLGDTERAVSCARRELEIKQPGYAADPSSRMHQRRMWSAHFHLGRHLAAGGDRNEALEHLTTAFKLIEALAVADPGDKGHRRWLAVTLNDLGELFGRRGEHAEAIAQHERAIVLSEELARGDAQRVESRRDLVVMHNAAARRWIDAGVDRAAEHFRRAESIAAPLTEQDPHNLRTRSALADARGGLAECNVKLAAQADIAPAEREHHLRTARQLYQHSLDDWRFVQQRGVLMTRDVQKPEATAHALGECEAALQARTRR